MARARPVEAATTFTAYSWDNISKFKEKMKNGYDENDYKLSSYGAKFDYSNHNLYLAGRTKPINLSEKMGKKGSNEFCRYWFWVKGNKKATGSLHWSTEYFIATRKPLTSNSSAYWKPKGGSTRYYGPAYNTAQFPKDHVRVDRLDARTGGFFKSIGKTVYPDGNPWQLDLYVIDLKEWLDEANENADDFSGSVYFQSVTRIYNGNTPKSGYLTTMQQWITATNGWNESGRHSYEDHYNQKLDIAKTTKHTLEIYRLHTSKSHPKGGGFENGTIDSSCQFKSIKNKAIEEKTTAGSIFRLKNIRRYYDDGKTYYLKGIRYFWLDDSGKEYSHGKFFIYDDFNDNPVVGTDKNGKEKTLHLNIKDFPQSGKEFSIFSGRNSEKAGIEKAVTAMFKKASVSDVVANSDIEITIGYYQPKTPTATVGYYRFYDGDGKPQTVKVFEQIDKTPSSVNSGTIGKSGTTYKKDDYLGESSLSRKIAVGKVGGQWVQVTEENKGQATDVRIVPLISNGAYTTEVKGYHGATDNEWDKKDLDKLTVNKYSAQKYPDQADDVPYFSKGEAEDLTGTGDEGRTIVHYPTKFKGNVVVAIYGEKVPSYTINVYAGTSFEKVTSVEQVQWSNVHHETKAVNTKVPDSPEGITRWVDLGATLADMKVQSPPTNAKEYGYRPDLTTYEGEPRIPHANVFLVHGDFYT